MAVAGTAALTSGLVVPSASADQMSGLQAQASALAARIQGLGNQEDALSERYDQATEQLDSLQAQVRSDESTLYAAQAQQASARKTLQADAIQAYIDGGSGPLAGADNVTSAESGVLRAEYVDTLAADQSDAIDEYHLATLQAQQATNQLQKQVASVNAQMASINADRAQVSAAEHQLTAQESQVAGEIQKLKQQEAAAEAAAAAAQQAAARRQAQAQAEALAQAQAQLEAQVGPVTQTVANYNPPPPGSGASGAVAAAESRVGDWYQWGATGPTTFDCSGLTMWAYEQVGISLPHYSGSQYDVTTHIPMSDLQPGDLVFFSDPGEHVAMYIGNGEIVEAPHTGAQVHITAMYSEFVLASRVEG